MQDLRKKRPAYLVTVLVLVQLGVPALSTRAQVPDELFTVGGTFYMNAGGGEVVDGIGRTWKSDGAYIQTTTAVASFPDLGVDRALLSDPDVPEEVFQTERWRNGDIVYDIPVQVGVYRVVVYFAEMCVVCVGEPLGGTGASPDLARVVDVEVEGRTITAYDQSDAAFLPPDDGIGRTQRATELVFFAAIDDESIDFAIRDRGDGNPPENANAKAFAITRLDAEILELDETQTATLTPAAPGQLYLLRAPLRTPVRVTATDGNPLDANRLFLKWGDIPTPAFFDRASDGPIPSSPSLTIPFFRNRDCLILLQARELDDSSNVVDVLAESSEVLVDEVTPFCVDQDGAQPVTLTVFGAGFLSGRTEFRATSQIINDISFDAIDVIVTSSTRAEVTFDLTGALQGPYRVRARNPDIGGGSVDTKETAFLLKPSELGPIVTFDIEGPGFYRAGRLSKVTLWYRNEGDAPTTAPLLRVSAPPGTQLRLGSDDDFQGDTLLVLGVGRDHLAGRLAPDGRTYEIPIYFQTDQTGEIDLEVSMFTPGADDLVGWAAAPRPPGILPGDWETLQVALEDQLGETWREYHASIAALATRLHRRGEDAASVTRLFRFASRDDLGIASSAIVGQVRDKATLLPSKDVTVVARQSDSPVSRSTTDQNGYFALDFLEGGTSYTIGFVDHGLGAVIGPGQPREFAVPVGDDLLNVSFDVERQPNSVVPACPGCLESRLPDAPLLPPAELFEGRRTVSLAELISKDPNEKRESENGESCQGDPVEYTILFTNDPEDPDTAGPVQSARIEDFLDPAQFDLNTFRMTGIVIDGVPVDTLVQGIDGVFVTEDFGSGFSDINEDISDLTIVDDFCLSINCGLSFANTGDEPACFTCELRALAPPVGDGVLPADVGFLEPGATGEISFVVVPDEDLDDTEIKNRATITFEFDTDDPESIVTEFVRTDVSDCLPGGPRDPIPEDGRATPVELDVTLHWRADHAEEFDLFLWEAGDPEPTTPINNDRLTVSGFRPGTLERDRLYNWKVVAHNSRGRNPPPSPIWTFNTGLVPTVFRRGDVDVNGRLEVTDPISNLTFQFLGTFEARCRDALDFDDNGRIEVTDPINNLTHQFLGGAGPQPPGKASCGVDPTPDAEGDLGCEDYPAASCE